MIKTDQQIKMWYQITVILYKNPVLPANMLFPCCLYFCLPVHSQEYTVRHYSTANGLLQSRMKGMIKDRCRFMWLIRENGIVRCSRLTFSGYKDLHVDNRRFTIFYGNRRPDSIDGPDTPDLQYRHPFPVIIHNLAGNAVKCTPNGSIAIDAAAVQDSTVITIADTGCGMSAAPIEYYTSLHQNTDNEKLLLRQYAIGLHPVPQLIRILNGSMETNTHPPSGTFFSITLKTTNYE